MSESVNQDLIRRVLAGEDPGRETLSRLVEQRVRAYFNRVLLDPDRAADLTQDTILSVLQSLDALKNPDRFWPWTFTIASNKVRQQFRQQSRHRTTPMSAFAEAELPVESTNTDDVVEHLSRVELAGLTRQALARLDGRYRMALALRFYEDLPHREIARVLGCSEVGARAVFFRAKRAMMRELKRLGVGKGALLAALAAFGESTMSSSASAGVVAVSTAAVTESVLMGLLPAKVKTGMAVAAGLLLTTLILMPLSEPSASTGNAPTCVRFVEQSMTTPSDDVGFGGTRSRGAYEQWFKFPSGLGGPMLLRMQRWDPYQKQKLCWWVQNEDANYYVHSGKGEIHLHNWRLYRSSLATRILPTDPEAFSDFIHKMDGTDLPKSLTYTRDPKTGFLAGRVDRRFEKLGPFETVYDYSPLDEKLFQAPAGMPVLDERDKMHQRGWTYFRVEGQLAGHDVAGIGQIPFVYGQLKSHPPWLKLLVAGEQVAVDTGERAAILINERKVSSLPGGSLFRGLSRPWSGFHTIDTIRRDAAHERLWFEIVALEGEEHAEITVVDDRNEMHQMARFLVHLGRDVLEKVELWRGRDGIFENRVGELSFVYLDEVDDLGEAFEPPRPLSDAPGEMAPSVFWPMRLIPRAAETSGAVAGF